MYNHKNIVVQYYDHRPHFLLLILISVRIFDCPQRSLGQGNILHLSVILFTGGGVHRSPLAGKPPGRYTPPGQVHPPPWASTPLAGTPLAGTPPRQVHPQAGTPPGRYTPRAVHAGRYGQQAGITHPTGMHSC